MIDFTFIPMPLRRMAQERRGVMIIQTNYVAA